MVKDNHSKMHAGNRQLVINLSGIPRRARIQGSHTYVSLNPRRKSNKEEEEGETGPRSMVATHGRMNDVPENSFVKQLSRYKLKNQPICLRRNGSNSVVKDSHRPFRRAF